MKLSKLKHIFDISPEGEGFEIAFNDGWSIQFYTIDPPVFVSDSLALRDVTEFDDWDLPEEYSTYSISESKASEIHYVRRFSDDAVFK